MEFVSTSPEQTKQIAADFSQTLKGGETVLLEGELGAGKTTFVSGLAKALGYEGPVRSPTFTLTNIYPTPHPTISKIVHVDLYRLKSEADLRPLALEEMVNDSTIVLIEWPELIESSLQKGYTRIIFKEVLEGRQITFLSQ